MREPTRRRVRPCKQMMMRRQWRRPPNNRQDAKLVSERCLTSNDPSSLPPAKATGTLLVRSFSEEEEDLLIRLHALLGNRWSLIAGRLPGRTDEEVKTHWDSQMRTKLKRMSVSPENHRVHPNEREEHRPKHPGHSFFSSSKCGDGVAADDYYATSDAGSSNDRHRQERGLAELNLELTLSTPCIYFGDQENRSRH